MAVTPRVAIFPAGGFSPVSRRQSASSAGRSKPTNPIFPGAEKAHRRIAVSVDEAMTTGTPLSSTAQQGSQEKGERITKEWLKEVEESERKRERRRLRDYCEQATEMVTMGSGGGPPRWFSPLECAPPPAVSGVPLLLYLPGADGVGVGLLMHYDKLARMFDVWCLHIPPMDRTPFTELVKLVERTVRSQHHRSPNRPVYLVGESLGGCLALAVAACAPDIDLVLIMANPATSFNKSLLEPLLPLLEATPDQARLSLSYVLSIMTTLAAIFAFFISYICHSLGTVMTKMIKGLPLQQTVGELSRDLAAISSYLSVLAGTLPKEALLWKLKLLKEASTYANSRLHAVNAQTRILSSGRDQFLPSQAEAKRLHRTLQKCELRRFNNSGHFLFLDGDVDLVTVIKGASFYRHSKDIDYITDYVPLTPSETKKIRDSFRWLYLAASPVMLSTLESGKVVKGLEGITTEGPVLLVGYHALLGMELIPLVLEFLIRWNIVVRGMAHPMMFTKDKDGRMPDFPLFHTFRTMGAIPVTATNLFKLLSSKSHVLLYPGGVREAFHRKGEEYKLFWPERSEFVRMAARFGAKIVPFGVVGEDDLCEVVFDYDDMMKIPYLKNKIEEVTNDVTKLRTSANGELANQALHVPGILPKLPGRLYCYFGKPIETQGKNMDKEKAQELYLEVKSGVESCLAYLKEKRKSDPYRNLTTRLLYQITHDFDSDIPTFEL